MSSQHLGGIKNDTNSSYISVGGYGPLENSAANMNHTNRTDSGYGYSESTLADEHARIVGGMLCELGQCPWQVC